jgi:HEPN domain-containing protein
MPLEGETSEEWMELARSDLAVARAARVPDAVPATPCFLAQQAAEKGLKAVLLSRQAAFGRTHNIGALLDLLPPDLAVPADVEQAALLTRYAVETRYPGTHERPTWEDYERVLRLAQAVVDWAAEIVSA